MATPAPVAAPEQAGVASSLVSQATNPLGLWESCNKHADVCAAGMLIALIVVLIVMLLWTYVFAKKEFATSGPASVWNPPGAAAAALAGARAAGLTGLPPGRERATASPTVAQLWQ